MENQIKIYSEKEKQEFANYVKNTDKVADLVCEETGLVMQLNWEYDEFCLKYSNDEISATSVNIDNIFIKLHILREEENKKDKDIFTKLEITILLYPENEKRYMMELDKLSKVDLILQLNHFNNMRKIELSKNNKNQK